MIETAITSNNEAKTIYPENNRIGRPQPVQSDCALPGEENEEEVANYERAQELRKRIQLGEAIELDCSRQSVEAAIKEHPKGVPCKQAEG